MAIWLAEPKQEGLLQLANQLSAARKVNVHYPLSIERTPSVSSEASVPFEASAFSTSSSEEISTVAN